MDETGGENMKCLWCGEELKFVRGKGWVHQDGKLYKTKKVYPRFCRKCHNRLHNGFCNICGIQYEKEEVDDHCALPDFSSEK